MQNYIIRLNVKELMKAQIDQNIETDKALAKLIGVSPSQVSRAKLPPSDPRYCSPGTKFIAGVLNLFKGEPFEKFFYVEEVNEENAS
jgi:hypothetical protein